MVAQSKKICFTGRSVCSSSYGIQPHNYVKRQHNVEHVPTFAAVESILRRKRMVCFPEIPRDIGDVRIEGEWSGKWADRRHVSPVDNHWGIVVFLTDTNAHESQ